MLLCWKTIGEFKKQIQNGNHFSRCIPGLDDDCLKHERQACNCVVELIVMHLMNALQYPKH